MAGATDAQIIRFDTSEEVDEKEPDESDESDVGTILFKSLENIWKRSKMRQIFKSGQDRILSYDCVKRMWYCARDGWNIGKRFVAEVHESDGFKNKVNLVKLRLHQGFSQCKQRVMHHPHTATFSFREVKHGLADDPEYVSVQVKSLDTDWYSDGIGSVFSANDGWGIAEQWRSCSVKVRVWRTFGGSLVYNSTTSINSGLSIAGHELSTPYLDIESGMIDVKVRVTDGSNNGFHFPATGAVQAAAQNESYGGIVYLNIVRVWWC